MNRPVHFEIPSGDPDKATKFYEKVFGWKFTQWGTEEYWLAETGPKDQIGIDGAILRRRDPNQPVVNSIEVADIDATVKVLEAAGGTVVVPKMAVGEMGTLAYFKDTDGNIFGLWQLAVPPKP